MDQLSKNVYQGGLTNKPGTTLFPGLSSDQNLVQPDNLSALSTPKKVGAGSTQTNGNGGGNDFLDGSSYKVSGDMSSLPKVKVHDLNPGVNS